VDDCGVECKQEMREITLGGKTTDATTDLCESLSLLEPCVNMTLF
jgi:hypothetical protein